jgi:hypothetical protein
MDCPVCPNKSLAMTLLPAHLHEKHGVEYIQCPADPTICEETVPWHKLEKHIVTKHGRVPCEFCFEIYRYLFKNN